MVKVGWITKLAFLRFFLSGVETYCIAPTVWHYIKSLGETRFFLSLTVCAYDVGGVVVGPLLGFVTDHFGNPRTIYLFSCVLKVFAYAMYSVNSSAYFPLFGRLIGGLAQMGITVLLGQVALQTSKEDRGGSFVLLDNAYLVGCVFGPTVGDFITFRVDILGWKIDEGNSPGIVLTMVWTLFLIFSICLPNEIWMKTGAVNIELEKEAENKLSELDELQNVSENKRWKKLSIFLDIKVSCLLFLVFCSEVFSSTPTFYVPLLALDHFHLELVHTKLLFFNCTLFTLMAFLCLYIASDYIEERKLIVAALLMQAIALMFLTYMGFSWDRITNDHHYVLLLYICFGMPYLIYPLASSLLSKFTDPRNATFVQGVSYAMLHIAITVNRVLVSFVFGKTRLLLYCLGSFILWSASLIWYGLVYKHMVSEV